MNIQIITDKNIGENSEIIQIKSDLQNKVDKIEGKGLSTNDYTAEEKDKLRSLLSDTLIVDENKEVYKRIINTDGINWTQSNKTNLTWQSLTYGNGKYIAGNGGNGLWYSSDGINWTQSNKNTLTFYALTYGNGKYIAASYNNGLWYSSDGINWTQSNKTNLTWQSLTYGNGKYIAGSYYYGLWYSIDGINWALSNNRNSYWYSLTYGNGKYIAGGCGNGLWYSSDGINWTQSNKTDLVWSSLTYGNGRFIAGNSNYNGLWYSSDGINWTQSNETDLCWDSLTYGDGKYIAGSNTFGLWYSSDGINWTQSNKTDLDWCSLTYGNGRFIAGSYSRGLWYSYSISDKPLATKEDLESKQDKVEGKGLSTNDFTNEEKDKLQELNKTYLICDTSKEVYKQKNVFNYNWIKTNISDNNYYALTYGNGKFIAASSSYDRLLYSTDGINWNLSSTYDISNCRTLTYGNGKFLAGRSRNGGLLCSTNGINWYYVKVNNTNSLSCTALTYGNGKFVGYFEFNLESESGDFDGLWYSTDGINWYLGSDSISDCRALTYGDGKFIAACESETGIYYSTDGINWSSCYSISDCRALTYGDCKFIAACFYPEYDLLYSTDGIDWTTTMCGLKCNALAYGDGKFIAACDDGLWYSTDGIIWTVTSQTTDNWMSLTYGDGKFIAGSGSNKGLWYCCYSVSYLPLATKEDLATKQDTLNSSNAGTNITITEEEGVVKINSTGGGSSDYAVVAYYACTEGTDGCGCPFLENEDGTTFYGPRDERYGGIAEDDRSETYLRKIKKTGWTVNRTDSDSNPFIKISREGENLYYRTGSSISFEDGDLIMFADQTCLDGDSLVLMSDMTNKKIKDITQNEMVMTLNNETNQLCTSKVIEIKRSYNKSEKDEWTFRDEFGEIKVTTVCRHRFYNIEKQAFVYMDEWKLGEHTYHLGGRKMELVDHKVINGVFTAYGIKVENEIYIVNSGLITGSRYAKEIHLGELK